MTTMVADKKADLAGPGIGNYDELEKILPQDYSSLLDPKGHPEGDLRPQEPHRGQPVPRAQPDDGHACR